MQKALYKVNKEVAEGNRGPKSSASRCRVTLCSGAVHLWPNSSWNIFGFFSVHSLRRERGKSLVLSSFFLPPSPGAA